MQLNGGVKGLIGLADGVHARENAGARDNQRREPLTAIPFADQTVDDSVLSRIIEICRTEPEANVETVSRAMGIPLELLERVLAEWKPRWRQFLFERSA